MLFIVKFKAGGTAFERVCAPAKTRTAIAASSFI
jgi:hypothetical protein